MMRPKLPVTLTDVAREAGVSIATVSRIINELGSVREETETRVRDAIRETGYRPKPRGKAGGHGAGSGTGTTKAPLAFLRIGEFNPEAQSPVTKHLETALHQTAGSQGRRFASHSVIHMRDSKIREVIGDAQGVVIRTSNLVDVDRETVEWLDGIPAVRVLGESRSGLHWLDHLGPDNEQAGALAADYLLKRGCTRLIYATTNHWTRFVSIQRCASFVNTARANRVDCQVCFLTQASEKPRLQKRLSHLEADCALFENRQDLIRHIARDPSESFGLFVPTDLELSMMMPQLELLGVEFASRCAAIGCDREVRCYTGLETLPATMDLLIDNLAERAIRRLQYRIQHPDEPLVRIQVSPRLVLPEELARAPGDRAGPA